VTLEKKFYLVSNNLRSNNTEQEEKTSFQTLSFCRLESVHRWASQKYKSDATICYLRTTNLKPQADNNLTD
jgi:hypothetical protein